MKINKFELLDMDWDEEKYLKLTSADVSKENISYSASDYPKRHNEKVHEISFTAKFDIEGEDPFSKLIRFPPPTTLTITLSAPLPESDIHRYTMIYTAYETGFKKKYAYGRSRIYSFPGLTGPEDCYEYTFYEMVQYKYFED